MSLYLGIVAFFLDTYGTSTVSEYEIVSKIESTFDLTPQVIINCLNLRTPIYKKTTNYGHFGKKGLPW